MSTIGVNTTGYLTNPPEGQIRYGMDDGPTRQNELVIMGIVTTVIAALTVALRFFTRLFIVRGRLCVDDYMVSAALACSIATIAATLEQTNYGLSYHKWDILFTTFNIWYPVYNIVGTGTYALSIMFSKLSILFFYLRLSPQTWFRWCTYILISASIIYSLTYVLLNVFPCNPVAANWDFSIPNATCLDPWTAYWAISILNIFMDVFTLILPIPVVLPLQMEMRQKISLILIFATGALVCAITIRRTTLIPILFASRDRTWDTVDDYLLSYAEINAGILCASVPALKPLFMRILPGSRSGRSTTGGGTAYGSSSNNNSNSTVIEQNRSRRKMKRQNGSFRLSSIDESDHTGNYYYGNDEEDEAIDLWHIPNSVNRNDDNKNNNGFEKTTVVGANPTFKGGITITMHPQAIEDLKAPPRIDGGGPAGYDARAMAASPKPTKKNKITVTRETVIRYDRDWI